MNRIFYPPFDLDAALAGEPIAYIVSDLDSTRPDITPMRCFVRESMMTPGLYVVEGDFGVDRVSTFKLHRQAVGMWATIPPVFAHWDVLSPKLNALAMDSDGTWYCYFTAPRQVDDARKKAKDKNGGWWHSSGAFRVVFLLHPDLLPVCAKENWRHSLILRPETAHVTQE